jgi:hypothetical protein
MGWSAASSIAELRALLQPTYAAKTALRGATQRYMNDLASIFGKSQSALRVQRHYIDPAESSRPFQADIISVGILPRLEYPQQPRIYAQQRWLVARLGLRIHLKAADE